MKETVIYWVFIVGLCVVFPPLLGFVLGIGIFCAIWWFWLKVSVSGV